MQGAELVVRPQMRIVYLYGEAVHYRKLTHVLLVIGLHVSCQRYVSFSCMKRPTAIVH
jgi:hypothetical protein